MNPVNVPEMSLSNGEIVMLKPRLYQQEMLEETMKQNVIVAMDTGSGKTFMYETYGTVKTVAFTSSMDIQRQLVWFLAPSVALCYQQHQYLERYLPAYQILFLSGNDNIDKWTEGKLWDGVLKNVNVVVSTPQVLLDALTHGFVKMAKLALLIYDEAHNGAKNSPMSQIMIYFYHPLRDNSGKASLPHILGLTASPVINADIEALKVIEGKLNAVTKTPKRYRPEFIEFVHRPRLTIVTYPANSTTTERPTTSLLQRLNTAYVAYDIMQDPYIVELSNQKDAISMGWLEKAMRKRQTYCLEQLKSLRTAASEVYQQLGQWAADWYIMACMAKLRRLANDKLLLNFEWTAKEKDHLIQFLEGIALSMSAQSLPSLDEASSLSPKSSRLIEILQRATAAALAQLLANHPATKSIFSIGSFVGGSSNSSRKSRISDLAEVKGQQDILDDFKSGRRNLVISTSVLEEGIDVPACNVVVSFDPPGNLVSYIQRRGRARQKESHYVMFFTSTSSSVKQWDHLEEQMIKAYMDEDRLIKRELEEESIDEPDDRTFCVESTQALLTLENATSHLHHFCQTLGGAFIDLRPEFTIEFDANTKSRKATVILPNSVEPALRTATSQRSWRTEKAAKKDAAFVAYAGLYQAGLINYNLLPLFGDQSEDIEEENVESSKAIVTVAEQIVPWREIAHLWSTTVTVYATLIEIKLSSHEAVTMRMLFPVLPPALVNTTLHWNEETKYSLDELPGAHQSFDMNGTEIRSAQKFTRMLLATIFGTRMDLQRSDFPVLFMPNSLFSDIDTWIELVTGIRSGEEFFSAEKLPETVGLIRDLRGGYIFRGIHASTSIDIDNAGAGQDVAHGDQFRLQIQVTKLPKRRDFLHPIPVDNRVRNPSYTTTKNIPAKECTVDKLPIEYAIFALFVPSILRCYEVRFVAEALRTTILAPIQYHDINLILTAICGSSAQEQSNYQRLEFLGDCVLKLCTSLHLMTGHPTWPESYLTRAKSRMVSNQTLAKAALDVGLDRFIILKAFTGLKWRPSYNEELLSPQPESTQEMSTKILADVVEALIGASFVDGTASANGHLPTVSIDKAIQCIQIFYPRATWQPLNSMHSLLQPNSQTPAFNVTHLGQVEHLISHTFTHKSLLLTALTHGSHITLGTATSYQRLEFLGDAVLDYIVTTHLFSHQPPLPHSKLHTLRTALVNADFLAFLCLSHSTTSERLDIIPETTTPSSTTTPTTFTTTPRQTTHSLWHFMLHASPAITSAQRAALSLHNAFSSEINIALHSGTRYPWAALARANAPKFLSDIVESVLGAAYVDSSEDMAVCEKVLGRVGVMGYLRRAVMDGVVCLHPKEEIGILVGGGGGVCDGEAAGEDGKANDQNEEKHASEAVVPPERRVKYVVSIGADEEEGFACKLFVHGDLVACVHGCPSRLAAETWAAERAVLEWEEGKSKAGGRKRGRESDVAMDVDVDVDVDVDEEEEEKDAAAVAAAAGDM